MSARHDIRAGMQVPNSRSKSQVGEKEKNLFPVFGSRGPHFPSTFSHACIVLTGINFHNQTAPSVDSEQQQIWCPWVRAGSGPMAPRGRAMDFTRSSICVACRLRASSTTEPHGLHVRKPREHLHWSWQSIRDSTWLQSSSSPLRPIQSFLINTRRGKNPLGSRAGTRKHSSLSECTGGREIVQPSFQKKKGGVGGFSLPVLA